jgi:hypothetical protein
MVSGGTRSVEFRHLTWRSLHRYAIPHQPHRRVVCGHTISACPRDAYLPASFIFALWEIDGSSIARVPSHLLFGVIAPVDTTDRTIILVSTHAACEATDHAVGRIAPQFQSNTFTLRSQPA